MALPVDAFADIIAEFAVPGGVTIERRGPGTVNAYGEVVPAAPALIVLDPCAVIPFTGRTREAGLIDRMREPQEIYATQALYAGTTTQAADVLLWQGRRFTMQGVEDYGLHGGAWIGVAALQEALA